MSDDLEFSINEATYVKILEEKKKTGFEEKSWDQWFNHIFNKISETKTGKERKEEIVAKVFEKDFSHWVKNFALNLNDIWNDSSARDLDPSKNSTYKMNEHSSIVIGRGPSIKKHNHFELLANSNYNGTIVCTEGALADALNEGITPDKFPKYFVVTIEPKERIKSHYDDKIVDKYGQKIKGIFSTLTDPSVIKRARNAGIKIHWLHTLFDYHEGQKSFNQISALIVRTKQPRGLPAIQTGGNVGTSSWFIAWRILKCSTVALIGINHGWEEDDPLELITSHGNMFDSPKIDRNSQEFQKLFPKIHNPGFNTNCILDPFFQFYSAAFREFISRSPDWLTTINATEGGSIFGEKITCMPFKKFLGMYSN